MIGGLRIVAQPLGSVTRGLNGGLGDCRTVQFRQIPRSGDGMARRLEADAKRNVRLDITTDAKGADQDLHSALVAVLVLKDSLC